MQIRKPFVLACYDTSLGAGRLSADWVPRLNGIIRGFPEAKGPVVIHNMGHGGWTSNDLLAGVGDVVALKPSHIFTEGGAVNDCPDFGSGPAISRTTHNANNTAMLGAMLAGIPGVDITLMTMSSVSPSQTARSQLGTYYADEIATATGLGLRVLDNYTGWPKPLDPLKTYGATPFAITPTAGFSGLIGTATFDAGAVGPGMVLSADLLTATSNGSHSGSGMMVKGNTALTGKAHFEVTVASAADTVIGIANAAAPVTSYPGSTTDGVGYFPGSGNVAGGSNAGFTVPPGGVLGVEVDTVAQKVFFMKGALRSSGTDISGIAGPVFAAVGVDNGNPGNGGTAKFSVEGDGLHPIWLGAVDTYLFPNVVTLVRSLMAAWWP